MLTVLKDMIAHVSSTGGLVIGTIAIVLSCYTFYWMRRRQFHRRNSLGVECFNSYAHMLWTRNWEFIVRLVAFAMLFIGGAFVVMPVFNT